MPRKRLDDAFPLERRSCSSRNGGLGFPKSSAPSDPAREHEPTRNARVHARAGSAGEVASGTTLLDAAPPGGVDPRLGLQRPARICGRCMVTPVSSVPQATRSETASPTTSAATVRRARYRGRAPATGRRLACSAIIAGDPPADRRARGAPVHRPGRSQTVARDDLLIDPSCVATWWRSRAALGADSQRAAAVYADRSPINGSDRSRRRTPGCFRVCNPPPRRLRPHRERSRCATVAASPRCGRYRDDAYAFAIDVWFPPRSRGHLCDLATGEGCSASAGIMNPQIRFGET